MNKVSKNAKKNIKTKANKLDTKPIKATNNKVKITAKKTVRPAAKITTIKTLPAKQAEKLAQLYSDKRLLVQDKATGRFSRLEL